MNLRASVFVKACVNPTTEYARQMTEKRSKYDTDPLDPDFVRQTETLSDGAATDGVGGAPSKEARRDPHAEEPTRRFYEPPLQSTQQHEGEKFSTSYPSVFVPPVYQPPQPSQRHNFTGGGAAPQTPGASQQSQSPNLKPSQRPIAKLGIPENIALVLPYVPFYIGLIASIVELLLVPRTETRTRFHAAQGLALQLVLIAGAIAFNVVEAITDNRLGGTLFWLASTVFLIVSMIRIWEGKPHHLAPLDELTQKINSKFEPRE